MMRQQHVNKEKLNKSILNASVDTVLCLTLLCVEGSNVLETVIGPTILAIVLFYYLKRLSLLTILILLTIRARKLGQIYMLGNL
jgi:hypothetical protein